MPRVEIMRAWEEGWGYLFGALAALKEGDLSRTVTIRGEPISAVGAIARQLAHYAWHVGQILLVAKHLRGREWKYVTVPPGKTGQ